MSWRGPATLVVCLLAGFLAFVAVESTFSPHFQACVAGAQDPYDSNPPEKHRPAFEPRSATALVECSGGYINAYGTAISALGTLVIAAFTGTLWVATSRQAQLTRESLIADQKAFVFASGIHPYWEQDPKTKKYHWRFRVGIKNSGSTPTRNLRIYCDCEVRNSLLPVGHVFPERPDRELSGFIPPGGDISTQVAPLAPLPAIAPQDILDVRALAKHIYIWGYIRYFDVFPGTDEHVTKFRWQLTANGDPMKYSPTATGTPPAPGVIVFNYVHSVEGNCADDECDG